MAEELTPTELRDQPLHATVLPGLEERASPWCGGRHVRFATPRAGGVLPGGA
ncbi:MAG TPA: hypothetical protein VI248_03670 [Kineosporiaceae bacterium]